MIFNPMLNLIEIVLLVVLRSHSDIWEFPYLEECFKVKTTGSNFVSVFSWDRDWKDV